MNREQDMRDQLETLASHIEDECAGGEHPADLVFVGHRFAPLGCSVTVDGQPLPPRNDLRNHSPDGFEWGYGGSGPAQLALAILCRAVGDELAQQYYQDFKFKVVAGFAKDGWQLTGAEVVDWLVGAMEESGTGVDEGQMPF